MIAKSPVPLVLVTGESGTGKQAIARMLHEGSPRASGPFVELNCSAIPENLVESELFGHERGAFSDARERKLGLVEIADGGTLFLDEIGDLGAGAQAKLLTFLEQRTFRRVGATAVRRVDARVVAATNRDLPAAVGRARFREDLYYRVNAITVHLPPLRERSRRRCARWPSTSWPSRLASSAAASRRSRPRPRGLLERYHWPGNVRELRAVISRATLLHDDTALRPAHLPAELLAAALAAPARRSGRGESAAGDPDARGGGAQPHPPRAGDLRRQPHARRPAPRHHPPDAGQEEWAAGERQQRRVTPATAAAFRCCRSSLHGWLPGRPWVGAIRNSPQSDASRTMSALVWTHSLPLMWPRWVSTVLMLMPSRPAICLLELPQITRSKICRSRCDSRSMAWVPPFLSARAPHSPARGRQPRPAATPARRVRRSGSPR